MTDLVRGEASESDDEIDMKKSVFASEINGEASESDEEIFDKETSDVTSKKQTTNVLQQLLIKNNIAVWNDFNTYVNKIIIESTKPLLNMDHLLIKTQMTFSSILSSLKISQNNVKQLQEKASATLTVNFIPNIKMK